MRRGKTGLRAIEREDLQQLLSWRNDPSLRRNFRETRELSMEHQTRWFEEVVVASLRARMWAIVDLDGDELCGVAGLCGIDWPNRHAELSVYVGRHGAYIDERHAPDAARLVIGHAFGDLALHRVWTEVYDFDDAKRGLLERLGFSFEGTLREAVWSDGSPHDSNLFGVLTHEWSGGAVADG